MKDSCRVRQALHRSIWDGVFANLYAGLTGGIFLAEYALAPADNRSMYIATFNAGASLMVMCASLLGGLALQYLPDLLRLYELSWSPFWVVFGASASLRIAALPLLARVAEPYGHSVWQAIPVLRNVRAFSTTMGLIRTITFGCGANGKKPWVLPFARTA